MIVIATSQWWILSDSCLRPVGVAAQHVSSCMLCMLAIDWCCWIYLQPLTGRPQHYCSVATTLMMELGGGVLRNHTVSRWQHVQTSSTASTRAFITCWCGPWSSSVAAVCCWSAATDKRSRSSPAPLHLCHTVWQLLSIAGSAKVSVCVHWQGGRGMDSYSWRAHSRLRPSDLEPVAVFISCHFTLAVFVLQPRSFERSRNTHQRWCCYEVLWCHKDCVILLCGNMSSVCQCPDPSSSH